MTKRPVAVGERAARRARRSRSPAPARGSDVVASITRPAIDAGRVALLRAARGGAQARAASAERRDATYRVIIVRCTSRASSMRAGVELQVRRPDQERMQLVPARRAVRADLVVERHDLVAVVRAEDRDVARVRLRDEMFDGSNDRLGGARTARAGCVPRSPRARPSTMIARPVRTLQVHGGSAARSEQPDARVIEQCVVQVGASRVARDVGPDRAGARRRRSRASARHELYVTTTSWSSSTRYFSGRISSRSPYLLRTQSRSAQHHAARVRRCVAASPAPRSRTTLRAHVGVLRRVGEALARPQRLARRVAPRRARECVRTVCAERLAEPHAIARRRRHAVVGQDHEVVLAARRGSRSCGESRECARRCGEDRVTPESSTDRSDGRARRTA